MGVLVIFFFFFFWVLLRIVHYRVFCCLSLYLARGKWRETEGLEFSLFSILGIRGYRVLFVFYCRQFEGAIRLFFHFFFFLPFSFGLQ